MLYIAVTKHGQQFPRAIIELQNTHLLLQVVKNIIYSRRCDWADLPHNPDRANTKQLLEILDYLDGDKYSKVTRRAFLQFYKERQA